MTSVSNHSSPSLLSAEQSAFVADNFAALSDPSRARILFALTQGEQNVNALAEIAEISPSAASHHLARLRNLRLVRTRRVSNQVFYIVDDAHVAGLFREMLSHLEHIRENLPDHNTWSESETIFKNRSLVT
jgi:DNA-binding transcriptional ArsR family regulator